MDGYELIDELESADPGFGSTIICKITDSQGKIIYDSGFTKEQFIEEVKESNQFMDTMFGKDEDLINPELVPELNTLIDKALNTDNREEAMSIIYSNKALMALTFKQGLDEPNADFKTVLNKVKTKINKSNIDESLTEASNYTDNPLKDAQDQAKKKQKGKGPFVKLDAGDVEHNTQAFNNAMGNSCEGGACVESLDESIENMVYDISDFIFDAYYGSQKVAELDVATPSDIDGYYKLIKTVEEAEKFNYHSDYWGADDAYQQENVELMEGLSPYVDEMVKIEYEDGIIKGKLLGIAIDKQYNSINHTKVILDSIEELETVTESIEDIEKEEKTIEPQTINIRKALNEIDKTIANSTLLNMYEACRLSVEEKQQLALMLAGQADANEIYDFLASKAGDGYLHSESHVTGDN